MGISQLNENIPILEHLVLQAADGTAQRDIGTGIAFYRRVDTLLAASDETVGRDILVYVNDNGSFNFIGSVTVPAQAGRPGIPMFDMLNALFPSTQVGIQLPIFNNLRVAAAVTLTNAISFHTFGGAF